MKNQFWLSIVYISLLVFLSSCTVLKERQVLAAPTMSCESSLDWKGIIPGKSSQSEVINKLGHPLESGTIKYEDGEYKYLSYPIDKGIVKDFIKADRIFFTADGIVSWIETVVGDRDGQLHEATETSTHLGNDLDSIFFNINYKPTSKTKPNGWGDILGGPDQIYVWSYCGLAIIALPGCHPNSSGQIVCSTETLATQEPSNPLLVINEPPYNIGGQISTDPNSIILYQYYFPPTSYQDFKEYILNKIAYYGWSYWDKFIYEYNSTSK